MHFKQPGLQKHSTCAATIYQTYCTGLRSAVGNGLAADTCLTAYPGLESLILARSHNFMDIDHEIIS